MESLMNRFNVPDTYAVWSKNSDTRFNSTSGGAFSEFAKIILSKGGIVIGAAYTKDNYVQHIAIDRLEDLPKIRQSKYVSSSIGDIYLKTRESLKKGKLVGFCGAPCQIAGLYKFLNKEYDNLFTMDFICRGMNSPKALHSWLNEIESKENKKVNRVWFKYKVGGWKSSPKRTRLDFVDGTYKVYSDEKNLFMYVYLTSNLFIRPCCCNCQFKGVPRKSDVTFADFWGIEKKFDDDKGTSLLLINSEKGRKIFNNIACNLFIHKKNFESIFKGNPMFFRSADLPENSKEFLSDLDNMSLSEALKKHNSYPKKLTLVRRVVKKIYSTSKRLKSKIIR